jgi:hypothetical protein
MNVSPLNPVEGLSDEQRKAESAFTELLAAHNAKLAELAELQAGLCENARTIGAVELRTRGDAAQDLQLEISQDAVDLNARRLELLKARLPELKAYHGKAVDTLAATEKTVVKKLASAGVTLESMPGYAVNSSAAEIVYAQRIRESTDWLAANAVVENAHASAEACASQAVAAESTYAKSERELAAVAARIAGAPVPTQKVGQATVAA